MQEKDAEGGASGMLAALKSAGTEAERAALVEELVRAETGQVLKLASEKIGTNQPFGQLGIDSLMALELVRRLNSVLGLALPATAVFNYPTVTQLGAQILARLGLDGEMQKPAAVMAEKAGFDRDAVTPKGAWRAQEVEELSEEEAMRALMEPGEMAGGN